MNILYHIRKIYRYTLELIFPSRCPVCDELLKYGETICPGCRHALRKIQPPWCLKCGKHMEDSDAMYCFDCTRKLHDFERGRALFEYKPLAASMYRFKYQGRREYGIFYGQQLAHSLGREIIRWNPDVLVPVPVHYKRKHKRGYNQAEVVADELGNVLGIPVAKRLIKRVKNTCPQKLLDALERRNNLEKAFKICQNGVKLRTIVLVDDIYTTGSTIDACAKVLKDFGAEKVYYISVCIGQEK